MSKLNFGNRLSGENYQLLESIIRKHAFVFSLNDELGHTTIVKHVDTGMNSPVKTKPYKLNPEKRAALDSHIDSLLAKNLIEESISEWSSPVTSVKKPDNTYRFTCDYRKVNKLTKSDSWPIPRLDNTKDILGESKLFSVLDLNNAYWQVNSEKIVEISQLLRVIGALFGGVLCHRV